MPMPNYGYNNRETRKKQELHFPMAPELVTAPRGSSSNYGGSSADRKNSLRAQVTTGKIDIDLERKLVIHSEKDKDIWRAKKVDPQDIAEARKYGSSERKNFRREVRSDLDSLISGSKARELKSSSRPSMDSSPAFSSLSSYGSSSAGSSTRSSIGGGGGGGFGRSSISPPSSSYASASNGSSSFSISSPIRTSSPGRYSSPSPRSMSIGSDIRRRSQKMVTTYSSSSFYN